MCATYPIEAAAEPVWSDPDIFCLDAEQPTKQKAKQPKKQTTKQPVKPPTRVLVHSTNSPSLNRLGVKWLQWPGKRNDRCFTLGLRLSLAAWGPLHTSVVSPSDQLSAPFASIVFLCVCFFMFFKTNFDGKYVMAICSVMLLWWHCYMGMFANKVDQRGPVGRSGHGLKPLSSEHPPPPPPPLPPKKKQQKQKQKATTTTKQQQTNQINSD